MLKKHILILAFLFVSCKTKIDLYEKKFEYKDKTQLISLDFFNKNTCEIKQVFYCENIPDSLKQTIIIAEYNVVKSRIPYKKGNKNKILNVDFLVLKNIDKNQNKSKLIYIKDFNNLCNQFFDLNSHEMKRNEKISNGVILNFINDSLFLKKDTIFFGFKKVSLKKIEDVKLLP